LMSWREYHLAWHPNLIFCSSAAWLDSSQIISAVSIKVVMTDLSCGWCQFVRSLYGCVLSTACLSDVSRCLLARISKKLSKYLHVFLPLSQSNIIFYSISLTLCRCLSLSVSCCSHLKHRTSMKRFAALQFLNRKIVGLFGLGINPSQGRYLHRAT
jgi:hypothetical protein